MWKNRDYEDYTCSASWEDCVTVPELKDEAEFFYWYNKELYALVRTNDIDDGLEFPLMVRCEEWNNEEGFRRVEYQAEHPKYGLLFYKGDQLVHEDPETLEIKPLNQKDIEE